MSHATIRPATLSDVADIADFHIRIWQQTYAGIAPAEAFEVLNLAHRQNQWRNTLSRTEPGNFVWIAEDQGRVVGLAACRPASAPVFQPNGEITYLYIDPECRGQGLGRRMLKTAMTFLQDHGFPGAALAVVRQNAPARRFYQRMGGIEAAEFTDPGPIWQSEDILVVWPHFQVAEPCPA